MSEKTILENMIEVNKTIADILKSQITQIEMMGELRDRIVELEKEKK